MDLEAKKAMKEQWKKAQDYAKARNDYFKKDSPRKLFNAVEKGDIDVISDAVQDGADVNGVYNEWNDITPLMWAAECGEARSAHWLLNHGAEVDHQGGEGNRMNTALHKACAMGHVKVVDVLLEVGEATTTLANTDGKTAVEVTRDFIAKHEKSPGKFSDNRVGWASRCIDRIERWEEAKRSVPPLCLPGMCPATAGTSSIRQSEHKTGTEQGSSKQSSRRSTAPGSGNEGLSAAEAAAKRDSVIYSMDAFDEDDD